MYLPVQRGATVVCSWDTSQKWPPNFHRKVLLEESYRGKVNRQVVMVYNDSSWAIMVENG